jgi:hypothetical protein
MTSIAHTFPKDPSKLPQPQKFHKRGTQQTPKVSGTHTLADLAQVYPRGVSSYLTTFLNDDSHASNRESESDSDDSFFSFSARLHVNEYYQFQPSPLVDRQHFSPSPLKQIKPTAKISVRQKKTESSHRYSSAVTEERRDRKQPDTAKKHSKREYISSRIRTESRKHPLPSSRNSVIPRSSRHNAHIGSTNADSSDDLGFQKYRRPRTVDTAVQTEEIPEPPTSQTCEICSSGRFPAALPGVSGEDRSAVNIPIHG